MRGGQYVPFTTHKLFQHPPDPVAAKPHRWPMPLSTIPTQMLGQVGDLFLDVAEAGAKLMESEGRRELNGREGTFSCFAPPPTHTAWHPQTQARSNTTSKYCEFLVTHPHTPNPRLTHTQPWAATNTPDALAHVKCIPESPVTNSARVAGWEVTSAHLLAVSTLAVFFICSEPTLQHTVHNEIISGQGVHGRSIWLIAHTEYTPSPFRWRGDEGCLAQLLMRHLLICLLRLCLFVVAFLPMAFCSLV